MMRPLSLLGLALAITLPTVAHATDAPIDLKQPPRLRVFGSNGQKLFVDINAATRDSAPGERFPVNSTIGTAINPVGAFFSMGKKNESTSIGMPPSFATRTLYENLRPGAKPFYREFALVAGQRVTVEGNFDGNQRCIPRGVTGQSRDMLRYLPGPTIAFTPEPGHDYEVSFGTDGQSCDITAKQLLADGSTTPVPREMKRPLSPVTHKVEGTHLYTFLFRPGSVAYRPVGEPENLQLQLDTAEHADAFEAAMREIAQRPGTQMCIVLPDFSYKSPLMDRLSRVMEDQGKAFPAILEPIDAMRKVQQTADNVPTTFMAAVSYCQVAGLLAFGGVQPPPPITVQDVADTPETPETP